MRILVRVLTTLAVLVLLGLAGLVGNAWWDSRLPGSFSAMDMGVLDYGGGPAQNHAQHPHLSVDRLKEPGDLSAPAVETTLTAQKTRLRLASGEEIDAWTFNGRVPGPEIRVRQGGIVRVTLVNKDIDEGVTIHWHGVDVPNAEDGVAGVTQNAVMPGERYTYTFRAEQLGTFWYHSHQISAKQVRRGLYGAFVIVPPKALPGTLDLTTIVHDFSGKPALDDYVGLERRAVEPGTPVRLRLVNSNDSPETLVLSGTPFRVVGIDGTEVNGPAPIEGQAIQLGGGARYDLAFVMPEVAVRLDVVGSDTALSLSRDAKTDLQEAPPAPDFDPAGYGRPKPTIFDGARFDRSFVMDIGKKFGFLDGKPGRHWTVNGEILPKTPMYVVNQGELVKMRIENNSGAVHPMHLHGHHLLVLSRNGKRTTGSPWWVDTLNVLADEEYEVAFRADNPGLWMDHCHNLPHAADGLTMHVMYEGVTTPFRIGGSGDNDPE